MWICWRGRLSSSFRESPPLTAHFYELYFQNPLDSPGKELIAAPSCSRQELGGVTIVIFARSICQGKIPLSKGPTFPESDPLGRGESGNTSSL